MKYNIVNLDYASLYPQNMKKFSSTSAIVNFKFFLIENGYKFLEEELTDTYIKNNLKIVIKSYEFEGKHILEIYEKNKHFLSKLTDPNNPFLNEWCNLVKKYERKVKLDEVLKRI
jgi:hypothetical protein